MRLVVIESPYAGAHAGDQATVERNLRYLRACMADCFARGEAPFASHGLYTQPGVLDDNDVAERERGIQAGFAWREVADATVVYNDLGIWRGMEYGIRAAEAVHNSRQCNDPWAPLGGPHLIEYRTLGAAWWEFELRDLEQPNAPIHRGTSRWGATR
jgi:hypothetical protein